MIVRLRADPGGDLAAALSTPLMIDLARTIYSDLAREPEQLIGLADTGGRAVVEEHLLSRFIKARYPDASRPRGASPPKLRPPPEPEQARRWLTTLAVHLSKEGRQDLAWWLLPQSSASELAVSCLAPASGWLPASCWDRFSRTPPG